MPFLLILLGTVLFLSGGIILPIVTVVTEQEETELHAFEVPGYYEITVQSPATLGLYDLSVRRRDKRIRWDKSLLHQTLLLTEKSTGQQVSISVADTAESNQPGALGFFQVPSAGQWLLIAPAEVIPEDASEGIISWSLRLPPSESEQSQGYLYLSIAIVGIVCSGIGLIKLVLPNKGSVATTL
jgi:hypothetical protein